MKNMTNQQIRNELLRLKSRYDKVNQKVIDRVSNGVRRPINHLDYSIHELNRTIRISQVGSYVLKTSTEDDAIVLAKLIFPELFNCLRGVYFKIGSFWVYPFHVKKTCMWHNSNENFKSIQLNKLKPKGLIPYTVAKDTPMYNFIKNKGCFMRNFDDRKRVYDPTPQKYET